MSKYLCDCRKCTNAYCRQTPEGEMSWCRPHIDTGKSPLIVDGDCGANFIISCPVYTLDPAARQPLPDKYPWGRTK